MTLSDFINAYDGDNWISIEGYCEEVNKDDILTEDWYKDASHQEIESWHVIGGGAYRVEICIKLSHE